MTKDEKIDKLLRKYCEVNSGYIGIIYSLVFGDSPKEEGKMDEWLRDMDLLKEAMESRDLITEQPDDFPEILFKATEYGIEINENGGWLKHLERESIINQEIKNKKRLEIENLQLQNRLLKNQLVMKEKKIIPVYVSKTNDFKFEYDIVLSFAGENRYYVETVASELKSNGINVFYDNYEQVNIWGKNLYDHLDEIYSTKALYCIMFISEYYAEKVWTNHERKSAQARAMRQKKEYILPARFDDTKIPGLENVSYIDLSLLSAYQFAELIINKLKDEKQNQLSTRLKDYIEKSKKFNYILDYSDLKILEVIEDSRFKYRAINKINEEVGKEKEVTRERLNYLKSKGLVELVARSNGEKWTITKDGKEYITYYYHELDEGSS